MDFLKKLKELKYSDFYGKTMQKLEKTSKFIKKLVYYHLRGWMLIYFLKHINPLYIPLISEKESIFFKNARSFMEFIISITLTGLAVNFVLYSLLAYKFTCITSIGYGLGWWLIQSQILKKGVDYLTDKIKSIKRG